MLLPRKDRFGLIDYKKACTPDRKNRPDAFDLRGIDRGQGAMVVGSSGPARGKCAAARQSRRTRGLLWAVRDRPALSVARRGQQTERRCNRR